MIATFSIPAADHPTGESYKGPPGLFGARALGLRALLAGNAERPRATPQIPTTPATIAIPSMTLQAPELPTIIDWLAIRALRDSHRETSCDAT